MPARPARPPGALPGRFAGFLRLPEDEVERVALVGIIRKIAPLVGDGKHLLTGNMAEFPEFGPIIYMEIDVSISLVGNPGLQ